MDRHATDEELKLAHIQFRTALLAAERRGFQHLGVTPDWPEADLQEHWHPYVGEQAEDAS
ncbi:MAG: hypothetical protein ACI8Q9_000685 [Planctomycetota bacterium]